MTPVTPKGDGQLPGEPGWLNPAGIAGGPLQMRFWASRRQCGSNPGALQRHLGPETGMWEITPEKSASIRQPHWHRNLDVKRPYRRCAGSHDPEVVMIEAVVPIKAD